MNALTPILEYKREEVAALKASVSFSELDRRARDQEAPRGFSRRLTEIASTGENALICELKRKSPSAGEILLGADPVEIANEYEAGGAACLSILTDGPSFGGALSDLRAIREAVSLPLLRKDFMLDPLQVLEARANGADAILVIMAAVGDNLARDLCETANALGMDALIEVHNQLELERAMPLPSHLIGINNRDLTQMTTDLSVTEVLSERIPADKHLISESGVKTASDITRLRTVGARRFLIGESLMLTSNRSAMVSLLRLAGTD